MFPKLLYQISEILSSETLRFLEIIFGHFPLHFQFNTIYVRIMGQKGESLAYMCRRGPYECDACGFCNDENEESED